MAEFIRLNNAVFMLLEMFFLTVISRRDGLGNLIFKGKWAVFVACGAGYSYTASQLIIGLGLFCYPLVNIHF
ncbi:MAG TPA: hypothetical protein PKE57_11360 [Cellvibrionaceae bacterium]|nr:hypothetical protein [Cellvibrionaceae bacterium]